MTLPEQAMPITCPACRATNDTPPSCRRCKADLSPLFDLQRRREGVLNSARKAIRDGDWDAADRQLREANRLRRGEDVRKLSAIVCLLRGDFAAAWAEYRRLTATG